MQDAARWCLACSEKDGIQHKDANKSGDATLHRQGDLNDREACEDRRKRDSVATFEDPADMGRQRRTEGDGEKVARRQDTDDGVGIILVQHRLGICWPDHFDRVCCHQEQRQSRKKHRERRML